MKLKLDKNWLVGFVDGEGCFFVGINKNETMFLKEQVLPEFRIVQHERDIYLLQSIKVFFGCGVVTYNRGINSDSKIMEYRVRKLEDLVNIIIPFFTENRLLSVKKHSFDYFTTIVSLMNEKKHLTADGLDHIKKLKAKMNAKLFIL